METSSSFPISQPTIPASSWFFLDLKLPPNTMRVLSQGQASGRFLTGNGPTGQPVQKANTTFAQGLPVFQPVSQLSESAQSRPPPVKARARRGTRPAKSRDRDTTFVASRQSAITGPSWTDGTTRHRFNSTSTERQATTQVGATPSTAYAEPHAAAVAADISQEEHSNSTSAPTKPLVWIIATAAEIRDNCGLGGLPINLLEQVLPRFRAFLQEHEGRRGTNASQAEFVGGTAPSVNNSLGLPDSLSPQSMERPELLTTPQLPPSPSTMLREPAALMGLPGMAATVLDSSPVPLPGFSDEDLLPWASEQSPGLSTVTAPIAGPSHSPCTPSAIPESLTFEELEVLPRKEENTRPAPMGEEGPSAALEFLRDLEYSRAVDAWQVEYPLALPSREDFERTLCFVPSNPSASTEPGLGAGIGGNGVHGFAHFDFLDEWEGRA